MVFKLTYEINLKTMCYEIKLDDRGLTDQQCYEHCFKALRLLEAHLLHGKPGTAGIN